MNDQFKVRFSVADNPNNSVTEAGVDAFRVIGFRQALPGDFDVDGEVDLADFDGFQRALTLP
ncbi:MAG: hypothetical protein V2A79_10980 [Planctomycetota bacterium]